MYHIGDKVVYPMHGAGIIEAIEEKKILNERQQYYIMRIPIGDMKVMIPISHSVEIGIRDVIDIDTAKDVLVEFEQLCADFSSNWNKRYRENMLKIKSGDILEVAYVVKTLMLRDKLKGLSTGERKMLNNARQILISELVLSQISCQETIENELERIVEEDFNKMSHIPSP